MVNMWNMHARLAHFIGCHTRTHRMKIEWKKHDKVMWWYVVDITAHTSPNIGIDTWQTQSLHLCRCDARYAWQADGRTGNIVGSRYTTYVSTFHLFYMYELFFYFVEAQKTLAGNFICAWEKCCTFTRTGNLNETEMTLVRHVMHERWTFPKVNYISALCTKSLYIRFPQICCGLVLVWFFFHVGVRQIASSIFKFVDGRTDTVAFCRKSFYSMQFSI